MCTSAYAAFPPFSSHPCRSGVGRFPSSPSVATISEGIARNGKYPPGTGRIVNNYLIINYTAGVDPGNLQTISNVLNFRPQQLFYQWLVIDLCR